MQKYIAEWYQLAIGLCNGRQAGVTSALGATTQGRIGGRRPKLQAIQRQEIVQLVSSGKKIAADVARLFNVHPATVSRLLKNAVLP